MVDHCLECDLKSCHHLYCHDSALVLSLKRRVRDLREQLQRKELHLDLVRRKLAVQEDNAKAKCIALNERDDANCRAKDLLKQVERLQLELSDARIQIRSLNNELAEATGYKITALERARKIDDLQKRLIESESLRLKYNSKVCQLSDQVKTSTNVMEQERHISGHSIHVLRDELSRVKENLSDLSRRESQLQSFKCSIAKILGCVLPMPDYEIISRLQKLVDAHHDFTVVSKRYDDPSLRLTSRTPTPCTRFDHELECEILKTKACPYI